MKTKKRMARVAVMVALTVLALPFLLGGETAFAGFTIIWVNGSGTPVYPAGNSCSNPDFNTIQQAVTAAPPTGATINVCPGLYEEIVVVQGRNNLILQSVTPQAAVI